MTRLLRRPLLNITLLAIATSVFVIPAASAYPVIDPGSSGAPSGLVSIGARPLTDGWYSAAVQQTRLNRAAQKSASTWYRSVNPSLGHGPVLP